MILKAFITDHNQLIIIEELPGEVYITELEDKCVG